MSQSTKKTVMPHSLAKALIEAGMQHYDVGGVAAGGGGAGISGPVSQGIQTLLSPVSGLASGLSAAFTTQNQYQAGLAPIDETNYGNSLYEPGNQLLGQGQNQLNQGFQNQLQDRQRQLALEKILSDQAQGLSGPSVAQQQLAKATGQNIQAQGALAAGTRGGGQNVGLLAKQAALTGGTLQQQAASDAAILRANEQIAARQALQNQQQLIGGQNLSQQGISGGILNSGSGLLQTGANVGQSGINAKNQANIENYGMAQGINAKTAQNNAEAVNDRESGFLNSIPGIGKLFSKGGRVPDHIEKIARVAYPKHFDSGGFVNEYRNWQRKPKEQEDKTNPQMMNPESLDEVAAFTGVVPFKEGGRIPGRAKVKGDSPKNDDTLILVSPGEEILPRSVTMAKDAPSKAAEFVRHLQNQKEKKDYSRVARAKRTLKDRVEALERRLGGVK